MLADDLAVLRKAARLTQADVAARVGRPQSFVAGNSGALSDWLGHRKLLTTLGYGLAAFTKPIFPLAATVGWVVAARFIDGIGKGIRDAPRDALVADLAPPHPEGRELRAAAGARYRRSLRWAARRDCADGAHLR